MKSIYTDGKMWLKGNLHTHTTVSDGKFTPERIIEIYQRQNYDFLMISDHEQYSNYGQSIPTSMTMIPGYEASGQKDPHLKNSIYHLLVISKSADSKIAHGFKFDKFDDSTSATVQAFIDEMRACGHLVILCHPHWSTLEYDEILKLNGLTAVEIYNGASDVLHHVGNSTVCYDALLRNGSRMFAIATDDNHNDGYLEDDSFRGWIEVFANSNSVADITTAIEKGNFYASTGPKILDVCCDQTRVSIEFEQGCRVYLREQARNNQIVRLERDLNGSAEFELRGDEEYIRLEVVDSLGRTAWTNPINVRG